MDLTPYYGFEEDAVHFHRSCRDALAPFGGDYYPRFKRWCDDYFLIRHRNEPRGVGGIFFDDFSERDFAHSFALTRSVGDDFLGAYEPILLRRKDLPYGEREREFQTYRRGRYVEFNLVYDRGHAVRIAVEWPHRGDSDVAAAGRQLALRLAPRAGQRRGKAVYRLSRRSRLAG